MERLAPTLGGPGGTALNADATDKTRQQAPVAEWIGAALEAALRARAPGVHASTPMVRTLTSRVGRELGLDDETEILLDVSVRVRDVGMVALPDSVVLATNALSPADWELVNEHPVIGAQLLERLPAVAMAAPIVRCHHERWDGAGYPDGRRDDGIPLLSRVIAACDAFVAMAADRPHRRGIGTEAALELVSQESGSQFDPRIVDALLAVLADGHARPPNRRRPVPAEVSSGKGSGIQRVRGGRRDLTSVIAELDVVPAFAPACERALAATAGDGSAGGGLVTAVESDAGLTIAVLRRAQSAPSARPIINVADAVAALSRAELEAVINGLPRAEFPWRTSQLEVLMHRTRIHAQAVTRAADRIARELMLSHRDDLVVAALLHDIGKLVLGRALPEYTSATEREATPEERIRGEQRSLGLDHASLGGLLLRRWGLPNHLASIVAAHHRSEAKNDLATHLRLADMVTHHAQGDAIDRAEMLRLAQACGLSAGALRDVLFDLPHTGGSQRRRAQPSPLSARETTVLRVVARGKTYNDIAVELGLTRGTVQAHLHNTYGKLGVQDRAQAVLRATEMGWI